MSQILLAGSFVSETSQKRTDVNQQVHILAFYKEFQKFWRTSSVKGGKGRKCIII